MNRRRLLRHLPQRKPNLLGLSIEHKGRLPAQRPPIGRNIQRLAGSAPHPKRLPCKPLVKNKPLPPLISKRKMHGIHLIPTPPRLTA
jgi:hypothetical protein